MGGRIPSERRSVHESCTGTRDQVPSVPSPDQEYEFPRVIYKLHSVTQLSTPESRTDGEGPLTEVDWEFDGLLETTGEGHHPH